MNSKLFVLFRILDLRGFNMKFIEPIQFSFLSGQDTTAATAADDDDENSGGTNKLIDDRYVYTIVIRQTVFALSQVYKKYHSYMFLEFALMHKMILINHQISRSLL